MPMTVVVTHDVPGRFRGFLASCMCEIAPGVYTAPRLSSSVRERVWTVLEKWWMAYPECSVVMTWQDSRQVGGQNLRVLGLPQKELRDHHGVYLTRRDLPAGQLEEDCAEDAEPSSRDADG